MPYQNQHQASAGGSWILTHTECEMKSIIGKWPNWQNRSVLKRPFHHPEPRDLPHIIKRENGKRATSKKIIMQLNAGNVLGNRIQQLSGKVSPFTDLNCCRSNKVRNDESNNP